MESGKIDPSLTIRLLGAVVGSVGFFLTALGRPIEGAALVGLGGFLLALGK